MLDSKFERGLSEVGLSPEVLAWLDDTLKVITDPEQTDEPCLDQIVREELEPLQTEAELALQKLDSHYRSVITREAVKPGNGNVDLVLTRFSLMAYAVGFKEGLNRGRFAERWERTMSATHRPGNSRRSRKRGSLPQDYAI
ncbi:hypothetical protein M1563_03785 [Patescibacteria group bacterium]|nr:hypothetical protein [Patescibacteria group bacterium]